MARMLTVYKLLLILACLASGGCGTLYVAQAAKGQLQILNAREPIQKVLADPKTDPGLEGTAGEGAHGTGIRFPRARAS